jgi:hypothetical protein
MQNAIKLENISNLITPPSSYQCRHKVSAFCYSWPTQSHTSMECMFAFWGSPKVNFQNKWKKNT